jgi:hypothetical protein
MRNPYAHAALGLGLEQRPAERRETPISRREEAESSSTSWTDAPSKRGLRGKDCCWRSHSAYTPWSPLRVGCCTPHTSWPRHTARDRRTAEEAAGAVVKTPGLESRPHRRRRDTGRFKTRGPEEVAEGAARSSTASTELSCIPRCLSRRSSRRRRGRVVGAGALHTPQSPTGRVT